MTGMTPIVKKITLLMAPAIFILGIYVVLTGHVSPGGGFAGGILIAGSLILLILAFGFQTIKQGVKRSSATAALSAGLFLFWALALTGLVRGAFFKNILRGTSDSASHFFHGGMIPFYDIAIGIGVSAALFAIFTSFLIARERSRDR